MQLFYSALGHVAVIAVLASAPSPPRRPLPVVLSVDLLAALPSPPRPRAAAPAPAPSPPRAEKIVLPVQPSATPERRVKLARRRRPRPAELDYQDALDKLRRDLGEAEPAAPTAAAESAAEPDAAGQGAGVLVSAETRAWMIAAERHIRATFVTPPEFRNRGLRTCMRLFLSADGGVRGAPEVDGSSGDPFWDDNAVRAVARATPLPPPPEPGEWTVCFRSEDRE